MHPVAKQIIRQFNLVPHIEGGYFKEIYRSQDLVKSSKYDGENRVAYTSIYYLLTGNEYSSWHKLKSDEIWHFYHGCPLLLYVLDPAKGLLTLQLGNAIEENESQFQIMIPANHWFAAQPTKSDSYTLVSCTVAPGFEYQDFALATQQDLLAEFPQYRALIEKFCK